MSKLNEMIVSLVLKNLPADDKAALEVAIVEQLSAETAEALKRRDDANAEAEKAERWLNDVRAVRERVQGQLKEAGLLN